MLRCAVRGERARARSLAVVIGAVVRGTTHGIPRRSAYVYNERASTSERVAPPSARSAQQ